MIKLDQCVLSAKIHSEACLCQSLIRISYVFDVTILWDQMIDAVPFVSGNMMTLV